MDLNIDLERDAAFERLVRLIHDPAFVSRHMKARCETLIYVPHIRYLTKVREIVKGVAGFEDVFFSVSTVTFEAMRGKQITFVLMPPAETLAPYQKRNIDKIIEWHRMMNRQMPAHYFTVY